MTLGRKRAQIDCEFECLKFTISLLFTIASLIWFITIGAICWMPDLGAFFDIIARLLKSGGSVLITIYTHF